ncbi:MULTISPECIES: TldD/PmbA family protein [Thermococcus]|nr:MULTISPECIES: TldD/PmbA family protein [Thermococcus]KUK28504.1 MAG: Zinc-dependent protease, TldD/PmbA family [Thermococcus sp. 40_45]MBC7094906.1 TldD/PmbA family protein [Thermococcus sp.]HII67055.1 TldD/PmbA family protein [Thermococcaceae archaeon]
MENLIRFGEKFFDELEIAIYKNRDASVNIELNEVSTSALRERVVTVVRGVKDKKLGVSIVDTADEEKIKESIERAYKMAKLNKPDEKWISLPEPGKYRKPRKVDKELKEVSPDYFVELARKGIELAREEGIVVAGGGGGAEWRESLIINSHGINVSQEGGGAFFYIELVGMKEGRVTPGIFDFDAKLSLNLNVEEVIRKALQKVKWAFNVEKSKTEEAKVILEPEPISSLLTYALFPAFSGEKLVKGTTPLASKVNESISNELLTIYDDPLHELSINPVIADDEGVPTRKNVLVEKGIFNGFIWDNYWAKLQGLESTGNAKRSLNTGGISIGFHNVIIEKGKKSLEDLVGEIDHGYLVDGFQGAHSSNPDNGNFAVVANPAFLIKDGEVTGSTVFMMSGNIYELLPTLYEVSKEQRVLPFGGSMVVPAMAFENVRIAGK